MRPTKAGSYRAQLIEYAMANTRLLGLPETVTVVEGEPNPRNHHLMVKTGFDQPRLRGLDCYEWNVTSEAEAKGDELRRQLMANVA